MNNARPIRRALISVSDKTGIVEFAQALTTAVCRYLIYRRHCSPAC